MAVYSDPDAGAPYVSRPGRRCGCPGPAPADTYLRGEVIIAAAVATGADAVHPGYGFLSENAAFARACADAGLIFVGPAPDAIAAMGDKVTAKAMMARPGVPVLPGATIGADGVETDAASWPARQRRGIPAAGQGGVRRRRPRHAAGGRAGELAEAVATARREAASAFGDGTVFLERFVTDPRHVEVQILGDSHGEVVRLFERECSIQRRYQKIVEECPSPAVDDGLRAALTAAAVTAGQAMGYTGAGTVEFVLGQDGSFYFLEMNTRLQVEHPVTEAGHRPGPGRAAAAGGRGRAAAARGPGGADHRPRHRGPAVRRGRAGRVPAGHRHPAPVRDPGGAGDPGGHRLHRRLSGQPALRRHAGQGDRARPEPGRGARRLAAALAGAQIHGVTTNRDLLTAILREPEFLAGGTDTGYLSRHEPAALAASADPATGGARAGRGPGPAGGHRAQARVLGTLPSGWRNVFSAPQRASYIAAGEQYDVTYRVTGSSVQASVNGVPAGESLVIRAASPDRLDLEIDGERAGSTASSKPTVSPTSTLATARAPWTDVPRFGDPERAAPVGSLLAPMPGLVLRVLAEVGAVVAAGQPLLVLEAMKMEQTVSAPADGVVAELRAKAGEQVSTGQILAVLEAPDEDSARAEE